jgi:hypothetical protein
MNVDHIFATMNHHEVRYLLIGGMNFMLRHEPTLTFDVDLWIEDSEENRRRCETALVELETTWGPTDDTWQPVASLGSGWLDEKRVCCTLNPWGAINILRSVAGQTEWLSCHQQAELRTTKRGTYYRALGDNISIQMTTDYVPEQQKRQRSADPALLWNVFQQTIGWIDSQQTVPRNSPQACLAKQAKILASMNRTSN